MSRISIIIRPILVSAVAFFFIGPIGQVQAQITCDNPTLADHLPDNCQKVMITASGNQRPTKIWALKTARDGWQDQVIAKYGERYALWNRAACLKEECFPSALGGFRRCILSGYPCIEKPDLAAMTDPSLILEVSKSEIMELQGLLNGQNAKPRLRVDGIFGLKSILALEYWQKQHGIAADGILNRKNLELLRKAQS